LFSDDISEVHVIEEISEDVKRVSAVVKAMGDIAARQIQMTLFFFDMTGDSCLFIAMPDEITVPIHPLSIAAELEFFCIKFDPLAGDETRCFV
jgi:hypothetical protein